ncbi:MAG: SLBB domain-containing protein, partial [Planctomycetota bacterium]
MRATILLCAAAALMSCCAAEDGPSDGAPTWLREAIANQSSEVKSKDKFKGNTPPAQPAKVRSDVENLRLNQPQPGQTPDPRVKPLASEPAPKPWRGDVPKKGDRIAPTNELPDADIFELRPVRQPAALAPVATSPAADVIDLNALQTSRAEIVTLPAPDISARPTASIVRPRQTVPAGAQVVAGVDALSSADIIELASQPRLPLSRIEALYNGSQGLSRNRRLEQFGYKSFVGGARLEANVPPDPEFVIGPGDEIRIKSIEAFEFDKTLMVDRDGTIFIDKDNIGPIKVAQLRNKDLFDIIRAKIAAQKGANKFTLDVSLGKLHGIRVRVDGFVKQPGLQVLTANATLTDVLLAAGGPTKDGTLRDIVIQRLGRADIHVDLYSMLATGNTIADAVLLSNDRVFVGPIGATAAVIGPAGSGIYELIDNTKLAQLMNYVGRLTAFTQLNNVQIERTNANTRRDVQSIDYTKQATAFPVQDGDVIAFNQINTVLNDTVAISGAVIRPGTYPFTEGMSVIELIRKASGFQLDAALDRAMIIRPLGTAASYDIMPGDRAASTREEIISIDLAGILAGNKDADIKLQRLDSLKIFTHLETRDDGTVRITGGVRKPGVYKLTANLSLGELIRIAGGPTTDAFPGESKIVRLKRTVDDTQMNASNYRFRLDDVLRRLADYDLLLENQDQIVIKRVQSMQVSVRIGGRVPFPGTYILQDGAKISDVLAEAGGLLPDADLRAAVFTRKKIQQLQQARLDDLFTRMDQLFGDGRNRVIRDGRNNEGIAAHLSYLGLGNLSNSIERFQARGRLVINMLSNC